MCTYGGQRLAGGVEFLSRLSELRLRCAQVRLDLVDALLQRQDRLLVLVTAAAATLYRILTDWLTVTIHAD